MSESESVDEDHWPDMDDPYEWREREGLPTYREREGGTVDGPLTNAVQRNAPQRMNTCIFVLCVVRLRAVTYTDSQGEIVVVDLTAEDETPSQQEVVAMPVDPAIEVLLAAFHSIEGRSLSTMRYLRYYKCYQMLIPRFVALSSSRNM